MAIIIKGGGRNTITSIREGVEKLESSSTADENVNWCSHTSEKHFGSSPKKLNIITIGLINSTPGYVTKRIKNTCF